MKAVFRVDASLVIGTGHVMRCLTLASKLEEYGWTCVFASQPESIQTVSALVHSSFDIVQMPSDTRKQPGVMQTKFSSGVPLLVVDNYNLSADFERACRPWAEKILVIDDLANRLHDADFLLDQTYGRNTRDYRSMVSHKCRILTGSKYSLLRPEFALSRLSALNKRDANKNQISRVLISLGNNDPDNVTALVLDGICQTDLDLNIDVVLGSSAPHLSNIRKKLEALPKARLLIDVKNMENLMAESDLAIGAGGTTSWERCCLGLPALLITISDNQLLVNKNLAENKAVISLGKHADVTTEIISRRLIELVASPGCLHSMSLVAREVCDGRGVMRVLLALVGTQMTSDGGGQIDLRLMEAEDESIILDWQRSNGVRLFFRNPQPPDASTHNSWMVNRMHNPDCLTTIIQFNSKPAGLLRFDRLDTKKDEVSILISADYWGRGVATAALRLARKVRPGYALCAEIHPDNKASQMAFRKVGFLPADQEGWYQALPFSEVRSD